MDIHTIRKTETWETACKVNPEVLRQLNELNEKHNQQMTEFQKAIAPAIEFLHKYGDMQSKIIIDWDYAEMLSGELGTPYEVEVMGRRKSVSSK